MRGPRRLVLGILVAVAIALLSTFLFNDPFAEAQPAPPAVYTFRGGESGFDGLCEGLIRGLLGLLTANGQPTAVPPAQRILEAAVPVGFTNAAGTGRAYDLDLTTFSTAFAAVAAGESLYSCSHGGRADNGNKGGVIQLDNGGLFDGFCSFGFAAGTNATAANPPYPSAEACLAAPLGAVTVHLHNCFSGADPDGAAAAMASVSATLGGIPNVTVTHSHPNEARMNLRVTVVDGPAAGAATAAQLDAAWAAIQQAATNAGFPNRSMWLDSIPFPVKYDQGQNAIDAAVPQVGGLSVVSLRLTYLDTGDAADPPLEEILDVAGCLPGCCAAVGGIAEALVGGGEAPARTGTGSGSSSLLNAAIVGGTAAAVALAAVGWYARRRRLR